MKTEVLSMRVDKETALKAAQGIATGTYRQHVE
jgi:hypothetical protein